MAKIDTYTLQNYSNWEIIDRIVETEEIHCDDKEAIGAVADKVEAAREEYAEAWFAAFKAQFDIAGWEIENRLDGGLSSDSRYFTISNDDCESFEVRISCHSDRHGSTGKVQVSWAHSNEEIIEEIAEFINKNF